MERKTPMADRLKEFVAELESKKENLMHTMDNYGVRSAQKIEQKTRLVQEISAKLLLAENQNDTEHVKAYEGQIEDIKNQIALLRKESERYEGVGLELLFIDDFPKLIQYVADCRDERQSIRSDVERLIAEKNRQIKELQKDVSMLSDEQKRYHSDFEADCIAPVAAYMPGGDSLNPYIPGSLDYTRRQQINRMLFESEN